jgi:Kdo2-lipid IVA lauroyltransferase/acyltransferase
MWNRDASLAALIRTALRLFARLSLPRAHRLGAALGWVLAVLPNGLKRVTDTNLRLCLPGLSAREHRRLIRASLVETGKTAAELGAMWLWEIPRVLQSVRGVSGEHLLEQARSRGRGVILASPHLGAWELAGLYCATRCPLTSLYRPPRIAALEDAVRRWRERSGAQLVPTEARGIRALYQALRRGEAVGILPDQAPGRKRGRKQGGEGGVFAPFFGVPADTMTLISRLAAKAGAPVLLVYAQRLPRGSGYHVHFLAAPDGVAGANPQRAAHELNRAIEQCVRAVPEQYQWSYKRFKTRAPGERRYY